MNITDKHIGQRVWLYTKKDWDYELHQDKVYTIKSVEDTTDYYKKVVVADEDGVETEVDSNMMLFVPNYELEQDEMIAKYLKENDCYAEVYTNSEGIIMVSIDWGDWKHEHGWCDTLMGYIGYNCCDEIVTEENGSDCYSAEHYFVKR